ncbi:MAG: hypothetical protein AB7V32_06090 [Candidatus Berkiella sp.]
MKADDLSRILNGDIEHIHKVDMYEPTDPNLEIIVLPKHVKAMLESYLAKNISAAELSDWATFLLFRPGEYVCKDWENDEVADYYEAMFYVVQKLSTPEIDGDITPDTVRVYLSELDKYFTNDSKYD